MNSADMVTDFQVRKDIFETPMGSFSYRADAEDACRKNDMDPALVITERVEMATVSSLVKAVNTFCGHLADEYDFSISFDLKPETVIPQNYRWLIAFAVEGGSEGYYVHMGAVMPGTSGTSREYIDFGFAKMNTSETAYELAKQASRFLAATAWN